MISIVVVYNDKKTLNKILLESLKDQKAEYELILVDNTQGRYESAAEALNFGGKKARGKYIMFAHQDIELENYSWLENVEALLDKLNHLGIAGVAGMSKEGRNFEERKRGYLSDCGNLWGKPFTEPEEVQTLDECLLIIPKTVFERIQFDEEEFDHWHYYGADYCLTITQMGLKAMVIPVFVYHRSLRSNVAKSLPYRKKLYEKHKKQYQSIYTTTGVINWLQLKEEEGKNVFTPFYKKFLQSPKWTEYLKREISSCDSVLDLGCGYNSLIQICDVPFSVGVELFEPYLEESRKKGIHNQYIKADIRKIEFDSKTFDAVIFLEVLEHLTKEEGYQLIKKAEKWARKQIIFTTTNGYLNQDVYDGNHLQEHKTRWYVEELKNLGFKIYGINGWKKLRGERGLIKFRPILLCRMISDLSQKIVNYFPEYGFQLFAVKKLSNN